MPWPPPLALGKPLRSRSRSIAVVVAAAASSVAAPAFGQAYLRWDVAPRPAALAGAAGALDDDPTALHFNPAGIARLAGTQLAIAVFGSAVEGRLEPFDDRAFDRDGSPGADGALYVTHQLAERLVGGVAVNAPWSLDVEWDDRAFPGRFLGQVADLRSVHVGPVLGYAIGDRWSVAVGLDVVDLDLDFERFEQDPALSALGGGGPIPVARSEIRVEGTGIGWTIGGAFRPSPRIAIGAHARAEIEADLNGVAAIDAIVPASLRPLPAPDGDGTVGELVDEVYVDQFARVPFTLPATVTAGLAVRPLDELDLLLDVQWAGWEAVDAFELAFADSTLTTSLPLDYQDAVSIRVGAELRLEPGRAIRFGYGWSETPAPAAGVTPIVPDGSRDSYAIGLGLGLGPGRLDLVYRLSILDDRQGITLPGDSGVDGVYESVEHRFGLGWTRSF